MLGEDFEGKELVLELLNKQPTELTDAERSILSARSSYLTDEERERYGVAEFAPKPEPTPKPETKKKK